MSSSSDDDACWDMSAMGDLLDGSDSDSVSLTPTELLRQDGLVRLNHALTPSIAVELLEHITGLLAAQLEGQKHHRQASQHQQWSQDLRGIFGDELTPQILNQILQECGTEFRLEQAVQRTIELLELSSEAEDVTTLPEPVIASDYDEEVLNSTIHEQTLRWDLKLQLSPVVKAAISQMMPVVRPVVDALLGPEASLIELSSLISHPGSPAQPLHADTLWTERANILTIFVTLQQTHDAMGPTVMLPCTHTTPAYWHKAVKNASPEERSRLANDPTALKELLATPEAVYCSAPAGTAFVMDSRLLHFGGENVVGHGSQRVLFYMSFRRKASPEELKEADTDALEGRLSAPGWWVSNGGDKYVDHSTMEQLRLYEDSMGSTMSLFSKYEGEFTIETLD